MTKSVFSKRYDRFRSLLVERRKKVELSQVELAEKLKTRQTFISKCELGERRVDIVEMMEFAEALNFDPHEIIDELLKVK